MSARAHTFTETFETTDIQESWDLVWNTALGRLHPPFAVYGWNHTLGPADKMIEVGTGAHGVFDSTTYHIFDKDGDSSNFVIQIDTTQFPDGLHVTRFHLESGWTLKPEGDSPLIIRSLSDIQIEGVVDCSGDAGEAVHSDPNAVTLGGRGRCGGRNGGNGGSQIVLPTSGESASLAVTGGGAGGPGGANGGVGGGGGGSYTMMGLSPGEGENPNLVGSLDGGAAGTLSSTDEGFDLLQGGAGGGGGSAMMAGGGTDSSGGAGGAGGGVIVLIAAQDIWITNTGSVLANGGNGGGDVGSLAGGGGGGGGGGTIVMFAGRHLKNDRFEGILARAGQGGTTSIGTNGGNKGGNGSTGRFWGTDSDGAMAVSGGTEDPTNLHFIDSGTVLPREGVFTATSKAIDFGNFQPLLQSYNVVANTTAANQVSLQLASGEHSDFDPTGKWLNIDDVTGKILERYVRLRVTLSNSDRNETPASVDQISLEYVKSQVTKFEFVTGCGMASASPHVGTHGEFGLALFTIFTILAPILFVLTVRRRITN